MIFRINTNIASINAQRYLNKNSIALDRSMERLSSGLRINRAADDAMGLYISESLRSELAGLKQISRNAGQAAAMVQTAESGYDEIGSILNRLKELAIQAGDGTISGDDREIIQTEADELVAEIDRIAQFTTYNGISLLDGTGGPNGDGEFTFPMGTETGNEIEITLDSAKSVDLGLIPRDYSDLFTSDTTAIGTLLGLTSPPSGTVQINGVDLAIDLASDSLTDIRDRINNTPGIGTTASITSEVVDGTTKYKLVLSGTNTYTDQNDVLKTLGFTRIDLSTVDGTSAAISDIEGAIDSVNTYRSVIGAFQNRLEHAISNINAAIENTTASDSVIRDADVAAEIAEMTRAQILIQAGTSVLGQANMMPQNALTLLP